jgi:ketopantoate hydroxymethyltransferase
MKLDDFRDRKGKEKIVMLTAYDSQIAKIVDQAEIDIILIGDSLGMVFQGNTNTRGCGRCATWSTTRRRSPGAPIGRQ